MIPFPAVAVVGYKKSGKTLLLEGILKALHRDSPHLRPHVIKHSQEPLPSGMEDTMRLFPHASTVEGRFGEGSTLLTHKILPLPTFPEEVEGDLLLLEGFKEVFRLPRILCLRNPQEWDELSTGLELACFSLSPMEIPGVTLFGPQEIPELTARLLACGFLLPGFDCGGCGKKSCRALAQEVVAGKASPEECVHPPSQAISVQVGNQRLSLNGFTGNALKNVVSAYLKTLKGTGDGPVTIRFRL